jgi:hypothetical protein
MFLINEELGHEDVWRSAGTAPPFLTSELNDEWLASYIDRLTPKRNRPLYLLDRRLSGAHSRPERWEDKIILEPAVNGIPAVRNAARRYTD